MSISSSDILIKFSTKSGSAGDSLAGTAADSLGKYISTTEVTSAALHNLFDLISGAENAAEESEYRCIFIHNSNGADTFSNVVAFITTEVSGGADVAIGVDTTAASAVDSATAQAVEIADEDTAPSGITFTSPTTFEIAVAIGDLAPGEVRALWIRRTTTDSAALSADGATIRVQGESL